MKLYIVRSATLGKSWTLLANDVADATGKVLSYDREWITKLEATCPGDDLDLDIKVSYIECGITEL